MKMRRNFKVYFRCGVVPMRNTMLNNSRVADGAKFAQSLGVSLNKTDINFYTDKMHDDLLWAKKIKAYLDTAIVKDEFTIYLQPKYDINRENIEGAEALVRWKLNT